MTLQEAKDKVAAEMIYARPGNYRQYKTWEDWNTYFFPSTKDLNEAWEKAAILYAKSKFQEGCTDTEKSAYISYGGCNYEGEKEAFIRFDRPEFKP